MGKREEKKAEQRERIISVAMELFNTNGYHETTLAQIASDCGISTGTLYNYFSNKADIVFASLLETHAELMGEFERSPEENPLRKLKHIALTVFERFTKDPTAGLGVKIFLVSSEGYTERFNFAQEKIFEELLESAKGAGLVKSNTPAILVAEIVNTTLNDEMGRALHSREDARKCKADLSAKLDFIIAGLNH